MKDWFTIDKIDNTTYIISEYRHWEETVQPRKLVFMRVKIGKIFVSADMVPMDMRGNCGNGLIRQFTHLVIDVANAEPRINPVATIPKTFT